jgi:hypothetical protein
MNSGTAQAHRRRESKALTGVRPNSIHTICGHVLGTGAPTSSKPMVVCGGGRRASLMFAARRGAGIDVDRLREAA